MVMRGRQTGRMCGQCVCAALSNFEGVQHMLTAARSREWTAGSARPTDLRLQYTGFPTSEETYRTHTLRQESPR